jgi:hypothetical protein
MPTRHSFARLSLFYVAAYLLIAGVGLAAAPDVALSLLGSTSEYGTVLPRALGVLLLGLALLVVQLIRHRADALYPTTLAVRAVFAVGFAWLYAISRDPFFVAVDAVIAVGMVLTAVGLLLDRRARPKRRAGFRVGPG